MQPEETRIDNQENIKNQTELALESLKNNEAIQTQPEAKEINPKIDSEESKEQGAKTESKEKPKDSKDNKKTAIKPKDTTKESLNFKCEQFFGKNWKYIASFLGIVILIMAYEINHISDEIANLKQVVLENNEKVVLTTSDGRAIKVTKEPLKAEYLKQFAVSTYVNNFIISRSQLTNNFQKVEFKDYGEVMDYVPQIRTILTNFMDYKPDKEKGIEVNQVAVGDLRAYVQWLLSAIAQDKLPEYISIKDYSVEKYEYTGNKFSTEIVIKVVAQSYILSEGNYKQQLGNFKIVSEGSFDLNKSSDINPYGMRIERLRIEPLVKTKSGKK